MKLSINIPTYNRDSFLEKNLKIIISQLRVDFLQNIVEINISDNASTDNTQILVESIVNNNKDISITYKRNERNLGPDMNFITAMLMAQGEFSILFGDDDFFEDGAIKRIIEVVNSYPEVSFFLSNRINVNTEGKPYGRLKFMNQSVSTELFDFRLKNDVRAYFSQAADHGALMTFISSVIYKTSILDEIGEYNELCTGSCYSFLYYWWSSLLRGKQILYLDEYLVKATVMGATNNNYGIGLKRLLVDTEGLAIIATIVFVGDYEVLKNDFLAAVRRPISIYRIYSALKNDTCNMSERLYKSMEECGWNSQDIRGWKYILNRRNTIKSFLQIIFPSFISKHINY